MSSGTIPAKGHIPFAGHRSQAALAEAERHFNETRARIVMVSERPKKVFIAERGPDRTPCSRCGIRADIGCAHSVKAA